MLENQMSLVAERVKGLRMMMDISVEEMAKRTDTSVEEYLAFESG